MKKKPQSKVSRITVARLYNVGNYEHIRYELSVDVLEGASAKEALIETVAILSALKPIKKPFAYDSSKALLAKPHTELGVVEEEKLVEAREIVHEHDGAIQHRNEMLQRLDNLGGTRTHKDAKQGWGDDSPF